MTEIRADLDRCLQLAEENGKRNIESLIETGFDNALACKYPELLVGAALGALIVVLTWLVTRAF